MHQQLCHKHMDRNYRVNIVKWLPETPDVLNKYFVDFLIFSEAIEPLVRRIAAILKNGMTTYSYDQTVCYKLL
jgi:hypothetical protein